MTYAGVESTRADALVRDVFASFNPTTGEMVGTFPVDDPERVALVVDAARESAAWWAEVSPAVRKNCLLRWAARLVGSSHELTDLINREQGKPVDEAFLELVPALEQIRWAARNAERVLQRRRVWPGLPMANHSAWVEYQPYGVVGVIGPWNYPVFTPVGSIAYALAAGNAVVFKPSEHTTAVGAYLVEAFRLANPDVPRCVLSLVTGAGATGGALVTSGVDKLAFTGSPATGKAVMRAAAATLTPVVLECGGKDPMIVADDADVPRAARVAVWGGMSNSGQTCVGIERVYVTSAVRDLFLAELSRQLEGVTPGAHRGAPYGPMTTPEQVAVVRRHITDAVDQGAQTLVGGKESVRDPFVEPVVLIDPPDDCSAVTEETFGPVLVVRTVADSDEAVSLANSLPYALGASVFSRQHGREIADRLHSGMVAINCGLAFVGIPSLPFGGQGESGFGRIHGEDGLREFARPRSYAQQRFAVPGMDFANLHRGAAKLGLLRTVMRLRHGKRAGR